LLAPRRPFRATMLRPEFDAQGPTNRRKVVWGRTGRRLVLVAALCLGVVPAAYAEVYTLRWDPNTDSHTVGYRVFGGVTSGRYAWSVDVGNSTSVILPELTQAGTFYLVVRAYNASGEMGGPSSELPLALGPPAAPPGLAASSTGSRVTLAWNSAAALVPASNYLVYIGTAPGTADVVNGYVLGRVLSVSGDLRPGRYYARVQAANRFGLGSISPELTFDVGAPGGSPTPTGLEQSWDGTVLTLSWNGAPSAAAYIVEAGSRPGAADLARFTTRATRLTGEVPPGTFYVRVRAVSGAGVSNPSNELVVRSPGAPHPPTGLTLTSGASSLTLQWSAPAGGPPPSGYLLEAGSAPGLADLAVVQLDNLLTYAAATPPPGRYYVRVRAVNRRGASDPSNEITVAVSP
jgi:hypothetical protein